MKAERLARFVDKDLSRFRPGRKAERDDEFCDLFGQWQHCTYPIDQADERALTEGFGFDGSSIRGWQAINASDMLMVPDLSTAKLDPFYSTPTVSVIADIVDPITKEAYTKDPRNVARKGVAYLKQTGIADTCYVGPEPEFFIFDDVRYESNQYKSYYQIDSIEAAWNSVCGVTGRPDATSASP